VALLGLEGLVGVGEPLGADEVAPSAPGGGPE